jgi:hypothetical protein
VPELPDSEVFKRYVDSTSLHQDIEKIEVKNGKVLGGVTSWFTGSTRDGRAGP